MALQNSWYGGAAAIIQNLLLPRTRAAGSAIYAMLLMVATFAVGPYAVGKVSGLAGSLAIGALSLYVLAPLAALPLVSALRQLPRALADRARLATDDLESLTPISAGPTVEGARSR